jgi:replicative DNA helicase
MHVDLTTRMGALTPATPTGFASLDRMLTGGLRTGTLLCISGAGGVGKTSFALLVAYMAARARAGVLFTSVALDETELMARLAARALHREHPEAAAPYGNIWSGQAWQEDAIRGPVSAAVETVVKKVGNHLHVHRALPSETTAHLGESAATLWSRHDRVVVVVDGIEGFRSMEAQNSQGGLDLRVLQVAYELRELAEQGCAVVVTVQQRHADFVLPAATLAGELRPVEATVRAPSTERLLGARPVELAMHKNRLGPVGVIPLRFVPGASIFEERTP